MKKIMIILLLLIGLTSIAQKSKERPHRGSIQDFTPEQIATLHTKKMTLALDLTSAQQSKVKVLALEKAKDRKAKMEDCKAKREEGIATKPTSEERFTMQNAMLDKQIAQKANMKRILSKDQYSKWEKMQANRHHKRGKFKKNQRNNIQKGK